MNREPALGNTSWSTFLKLKSFFYFLFFCNNFSHLKTNYDLSWIIFEVCAYVFRVYNIFDHFQNLDIINFSKIYNKKSKWMSF